MDGTSMATPHVSGLAALLLSYDNSLGADEVRQIIEDHAVDLGPAGWDQSYGFGRIDAHAAVDSLVPISICPVKIELPCFFVKENCGYKEYCLYVIENQPCRVRMDLCNFILETGPCRFKKEPICPKAELTCPKYEGCLKELFMQCKQELVFQPPYGDIYVKKGDPLSEPVIIKKELRHVKPLTGVRNISRKRFM
jgi:hypothetical protein